MSSLGVPLGIDFAARDTCSIAVVPRGIERQQLVRVHEPTERPDQSGGVWSAVSGCEWLLHASTIRMPLLSTEVPCAG